MSAELKAVVNSPLEAWGAILPVTEINLTPEPASQALISFSKELTSLSTLLKILTCCIGLVFRGWCGKVNAHRRPVSSIRLVPLTASACGIKPPPIVDLTAYPGLNQRPASGVRQRDRDSPNSSDSLAPD
jgi:hypothetical protein